MQEIKIVLQLKQQLFKKSIEDNPITLFGGARGGGKSYGLRNIFLLRRFQYPKSAGAIFRRTFPELEANHIRPMFQEHPYLKDYWNESKKLITLPNGSTLQFSHCGGENDVFLYQGREIQDLGIDEAGLWPEAMFWTLLGSNRSSDPLVPVRCALTANPGNIGHTWLKRLFIDRRFNERERSKDYNFIQSLVSDNPALIKSDPDYVYRLQAEPNEVLRKAYLYGDWDIQAGMFFEELTRETHLIKPFDIPAHWNRFGAYDYGFNHPAAFGWFANDGDGNTYLYRELIQAGLRVDQFAKALNKFDDTKLLNPIVAGHDCWTQKSVLREDRQPPTIAEEFSQHGIQLERAVIDRIQGAAQLRSYLAWRDKPNSKPKLFIFNTCPTTYETLARMAHDPRRIEDVLKVDSINGDPLSGDDAYDMARYGLMSRPHISDPLKVHHLPGSAEYNKEQEDKHIQSAIAQVKREKDMRENNSPYGSWIKDNKGIADWNKW